MSAHAMASFHAGDCLPEIPWKVSPATGRFFRIMGTRRGMCWWIEELAENPDTSGKARIFVGFPVASKRAAERHLDEALHGTGFDATGFLRSSVE